MQQISKDVLLEKLISIPLEFTDHDFTLLANHPELTFPNLRESMKRIFDINEDILLEESNATKGLQGFLNKLSNRRIQNNFYKRFRNGSFVREGNKVILAEGDSWFGFPLFIKDITNHLLKNPNYNIYSIAYAGDWLSNIIYEGKYVEKLSAFTPDVFLISGGGNDLVGVDRLGVMVSPFRVNRAKYTLEQEVSVQYYKSYRSISSAPALTKEEISSVMSVQHLINKEFYAFLWILKLQYYKIFSGIKLKFPDMQIITQGYDYAVPSLNFRFSFKRPFQYFINRLMKTGAWIKIPLMISGLKDNDTQRAVVLTMIFEMNRMFAELTAIFDNVYHIDCRGITQGKKDWYDELHTHSYIYKYIAEAYTYVINHYGNCEKIVFAKNFKRQG